MYDLLQSSHFIQVNTFPLREHLFSLFCQWSDHYVVIMLQFEWPLLLSLFLWSETFLASFVSHESLFALVLLLWKHHNQSETGFISNFIDSTLDQLVHTMTCLTSPVLLIRLPVTFNCIYLWDTSGSQAGLSTHSASLKPHWLACRIDEITWFGLVVWWWYSAVEIIECSKSQYCQ